MTDRAPVYSYYIDWYGHGWLNSGLTNWAYDTTADSFTRELTSDQTFRGRRSLRIRKDIASAVRSNSIYKEITVEGGVSVELSAWVYLDAPTGSSPEVRMTAYDPTAASTFDSTIVQGAWEELMLTLAPAQTTTYVVVIHNIPTTFAVNDQFFVGWTEARSADDDVTCDVLMTRLPPNITLGREEPRDMAQGRSSETSIMLNNETGKFTPFTGASLIDRAVTGREILVQADFESEIFTLYTGFTEDFTIHGDLNSRDVVIPCVDLLTRIGALDIHLGLYESIRTGDAVTALLQEAKVIRVPESAVFNSAVFAPIVLYIDHGMTTLRWWTYSGDARAGLEQLVRAEGPPAMVNVGGSNQIIFQDRAHRTRLDYSTTPAASLVACEPSPGQIAIDESSEPNYGFKDIFNRINATADIRVPDSDITTIWRDDIETRTFSGKLVIAADVAPFIDGVRPVAGTREVITTYPGDDAFDVEMSVTPDEYDFVIESGSVVVSSYTASGTRLSITLIAAGSATISGLSFRARGISVTDYTAIFDDSASQSYYRSVAPTDYDAAGAGPNDMEDVALWVLKKNSSPRPTISAVIKNSLPTVTSDMLHTAIGSLIDVDVEQWGITNSFTVESINHNVRQLGKDHEFTLGAQMTDPVGFTSNLFTFNQAGSGFDLGTFGPSTVATDVPFIIGTSELNSTDEIWY
jgi:hypothetical protein